MKRAEGRKPQIVLGFYTQHINIRHS